MDKTTFWEDLNKLKEELRGKYLIIAGDFNTTKSHMEKQGGTKVSEPFGEHMEDLMEDLDLLEPPLKNGKYTWSNKRMDPGHIVARLDRFLTSSSLLQREFLSIYLALPSATSDHKLIYLSLSPSEYLGPIPFRFNPLWL